MGSNSYKYSSNTLQEIEETLSLLHKVAALNTQNPYVLKAIGEAWQVINESYAGLQEDEDGSFSF